MKCGILTYLIWQIQKKNSPFTKYSIQVLASIQVKELHPELSGSRLHQLGRSQRCR